MNRNEYINSLFPSDNVLHHVAESISQVGLPPMSVKPDLGRLLTILTSASQTEKALEIGTFGGYSAICIARGLPSHGSLISLEVRQEHAQLARENLRQAGMDEKVEIVVGSALESLKMLIENGERFGLIFIDADKPNYPAYLDCACRLAKPGTLIIADNVLLQDRVLDADNHSPSPEAVRKFNQSLVSAQNLISTILPVHDGFAIACVRE
ncbi:O-methyltransferase [Alicyclobacillus dauci]|uniref:O-methyltransferase n=1 Tax=Alicyclobacillus dauci TaxID=1475485 RepID=A0ABY6Z1E2_9BACL|nr:O-methyltransferase [Alicyclobacillus dauci]WAH36502.1 O-methyltransferase [Alicyclobacillus dauci]